MSGKPALTGGDETHPFRPAPSALNKQRATSVGIEAVSGLELSGSPSSGQVAGGGVARDGSTVTVSSEGIRIHRIG